MTNVLKDSGRPEEILVSVVMPVYNGEVYLAEAIESVLSQTHKNFEFIIIDDGSKDRSAEIIKKYRDQDSRVILHQQANSGLPVSLNKGIELAKADIIVRMDADDIMLPQRLERQIPFLLNHPEATVVSCFSYHINSKGKRIGKSGNYSYIESVEQCKKHISGGGMIFCLHPGVMFWKKPVMEAGGYDVKLPVSEDTELWNRLADKGHYTIVMPERLIDYRIHMGAISSSWHKSINHRNWIYFNIVNRRKGIPEMSFEDFEKRNRKAHIRRLNYVRKAYGGFAERCSAVMYGEGKYLPFIFYSVGCMLLRPKMTLLRLKNHLTVSAD